MKRLIAFSLVMVLILTMIGSVALAARPSVSIVSGKSLMLKRGKTGAWKFNLKANSYSKNSKGYRAMFIFWVHEKDPQGSSIYGTSSTFTGSKSKTVKWKAPTSISKGKYVVFYGSMYRSSSVWKLNKAESTPLTIY